MENQVSSTKTILTYGLYLGITSIIVAVANYSFGNVYKPHWSIGLITYAVMIAFIVLGIKEYKSLNGGYLQLSKAIKIGVGIALVSGILYVIYFLVFTKFVEPDFLSKSIEVQEQVLYEKFPDMDEAIIEKQVDMMKSFMKPVFVIPMTLATNMFMGLIFSLIAGLIMKKDKPEF